MKLIVDASVAVKWFVRENLHEQALSILDNYAGELEAPDFLVTEVANVAWKKAVRGEITRDQAKAISVAVRESIDVFHSSIDLMPRAMEIALRLNHPIYDCQYVACAEAASSCVITADERFVKIVRETEFSEQIRFLGDPIQFKTPLAISSQKLEEIIQASELLGQVRDHVADRLTAGKEFPIVDMAEMKPYFDSPAYVSLRSEIERLNEEERADILALGWLGRGTEGKEWQPIRHRAGEMIRGHAQDRNFTIYICAQVGNVRNGLAMLRD